MLHSLVALEWWLDWVEVLCHCLVWLVIVELPQGSPNTRLWQASSFRLHCHYDLCPMVQEDWFQSVYGHFVLPASDVEEKVLGMPRNHRKRAVIKWLQWRLVCITTNKNKMSLLETCWHVCAMFTMGRCGCHPKRVSNIVELVQETGVWWIQWTIGHNKLSWQGEGGTIDQFSRRWTDVLFKCST